MLEITKSLDLALKIFKTNDNQVIKVDSRVDKMFKN